MTIPGGNKLAHFSKQHTLLHTHQKKLNNNLQWTFHNDRQKPSETGTGPTDGDRNGWWGLFSGRHNASDGSRLPGDWLWWSRATRQLNAGGGQAAAHFHATVIGGGGLIIADGVYCFVEEMRVIARERGLLRKLLVLCGFSLNTYRKTLLLW